LDRPTRDQYGADLHDNSAWEIYLVQWLEREEYDVSYGTNVDLHERGELLRRHKAVLSVGHDEYYTQKMFDNLEAARDRGINLGFLGANNIYWQGRFEPSSTGVPNRVFVVYKNQEIDPVADPRLKTIRWRDTGRPEQTLIGIQYTGATSINPNSGEFSPFVAQNTDSWPYFKSNLKDGDEVRGIIGYEMDRLFTENPDYPLPVSTSYTTLGRSVFEDADEGGKDDYSEASIYRAPSGAWVFASGTMSWSWGLGHPDFRNAGIQRVTRNILNRFTRWSPEHDYKFKKYKKAKLTAK
jgi:hypothetical protein